MNDPIDMVRGAGPKSEVEPDIIDAAERQLMSKIQADSSNTDKFGAQRRVAFYSLLAASCLVVVSAAGFLALNGGEDGFVESASQASESTDVSQANTTGPDGSTPDDTEVGIEPDTTTLPTTVPSINTAEENDNSWLDEFDNDIAEGEVSTFEGTRYRFFAPTGRSSQATSLLLDDHWAMDVALTDSGSGMALLRPDKTFNFEDGKFVVEADFASTMPAYGSRAWGEIVITTSATVGQRNRGRVYAYHAFPNHYTLGCRITDSQRPVCALWDDSDSGAAAKWLISFSQKVGDETFGGSQNPGGEPDNWRECSSSDHRECLDRFRLEITEDSLTLYVNGKRYFAQSGLPKLPDEFLNGDLYTYFASVATQNSDDVLRYHWDRLAVNSNESPTGSDTFQ